DWALATMLVRPRYLYNLEDISKVMALSSNRYGSVRRVFIVAGEDKQLTKEFQQWMIERNPPDEVKEIPDADHMVMMSRYASGINPKQVLEIPHLSVYFSRLMEFMASLPAREKVVLVGYRFSGFVISKAMESFPEKISVAVFVTALMSGVHLSQPKIRDHDGTYSILPDRIRLKEISVVSKASGDYLESPMMLAKRNHRDQYSEVVRSVLARRLQKKQDGIASQDNIVTYDNGPKNPPTTLTSSPRYLASYLYQLSPLQIWVVRMETYLDAMDMWEAVEEEYEIPPLPDNPTMAQIKNHKDKKTRENTLENTKDLSKITLMELLNALQAQEQRKVMRDEGNTEGALFAKPQDGGKNKKKKNKRNDESAPAGTATGKTENKKKNFPPCQHCNKKGHPPYKCWRRPDAKCSKYNQLGHEAVICKNKNQQQEADAQIVDGEEEDQLFVATCFSSKSSSECWLIDSGCTNHMTNDKDLFKELKPTTIIKVRIGNGEYIPVQGKGTVAIPSHPGTKTISQVLYVPEIDQNLLSVGQLMENGFKLNFEDKHCLIKDASDQEMFKRKSEAANVFWKFKAKVENKAACKIQSIRTDNGKEYTSQQFNILCEEAGIHHQLTTLYTPQQNGVSERRNRYIIEMTRCMLHKKNLPKKFWAEATNTSVFLQNRLPTKAVRGRTPFEAWYGFKPLLNFLKVFGCHCFSYVSQVKRDKLDKKFVPGIFIGYSAVSKAYKFFQPQTENIIVSRDVYFMENEEWCWEDSKKPVLNSSDSAEKFLAKVSEKQISLSSQDEVVDHSLIKEELFMIEKNMTWELVDQPRDRKVIGLKWAFRTKLNTDGSVNNHKARLVVKGYAQIFCMDYFDIFAPVARLDTNRLLLALAAQLGWKALKRVSKSTLYVKHNGIDILVVSIYVDDVLVTGSNTKNIEDFKQEMMQAFEMTDLGLMSYFLGMEIKQGQNEVFIYQKKYAKEILKKFHMEDCKEMSTPMNQKEKLSKNDGAEKVEETYFRGLVGCLMYLTATRPDILYVVSILSRFMHYASELHLKATRRLIRYIKGTINYGVKFQKNPNLKLLGYSDSDWAGSVDDMKSTSRYCFSLAPEYFLGAQRSRILWLNPLQRQNLWLQQQQRIKLCG
ncbi:putative ribonuclease H protein-like, partial [Capsicum annuum]